jgi:alkylation response protein AidB-like acyl-CoA dehydrogenase
MEFSLTAEQESFRQSIRQFAESSVAPIAADLDRKAQCPSDVIDSLAGLGLLGCDRDFVSYVAGLVEISRVWASLGAILSVHNSLVCYPIVRFGNEAQKNKYLRLLINERQLGCYGFAEPAAGSDAGSIQTTAIADGDVLVLNGQKLFVTNGRQARVAIVYALTDVSKGREGLSAFIVETSTPGLTIGGAAEKLGLRAAEMVEFSFRDCRVPKENLLGGVNQGFAIARHIVESGRIDIAAQAVGIAEACLDASVAHAKARRQFGRAIAEFEAIQWMLADMGTEIDAAKLLMYRAASRRARRPDDSSLALAAAQAKLYASEAANRAAYHAIQVFGGHGYLTAHPVERYFRDARAMTLYEETSEIERLVIERELAK